MNATQELHNAGQSIWLDNITRELLDSGTLQKYIDEWAVTGLTSNPTIFQKAIGGSDYYDSSIQEKRAAGKEGEALFFELAIEDLSRAADLFKSVYDKTNAVDGYVSLEVSPLLAYDTDTTTESAKTLFAQADRKNLFIKIPGTPEGLPAIEETIFAGIPVNVTLLFSTEHCLACADAYMKGIERRIEAGLDPNIACVASLFISRSDGMVADKVSDDLKNKLGIAIGKQSYKAYCDLNESDRVKKIVAAGGQPQRLLFASTGTKDPNASDVLYIEELAAPNTVNTMPEGTLKNFADHGSFKGVLPEDGGDCEAALQKFRDAGIDLEAVASELQSKGAKSFVDSWNDLMASIVEKSEALKA